jgi:hypothetical protein
MAKIDDVQAAAQKHADAFAAFVIRANEDFNNLKAQIAAGQVTDAALAQLETTLNAGTAALQAMDLDPNFPSPVPPTA